MPSDHSSEYNPPECSRQRSSGGAKTTLRFCTCQLLQTLRPKWQQTPVLTRCLMYALFLAHPWLHRSSFRAGRPCLWGTASPESWLHHGSSARIRDKAKTVHLFLKRLRCTISSCALALRAQVQSDLIRVVHSNKNPCRAGPATDWYHRPGDPRSHLVTRRTAFPSLLADAPHTRCHRASTRLASHTQTQL